MEIKVVIKVSNSDRKCRTKALKTAVSVAGVSSASFVRATEDKDERNLEVVGDGVDAVKLVTLLRKSVGHAELISVNPIEKNKGEYKTAIKKNEGEHFFFTTKEGECRKQLEAAVRPYSFFYQEENVVGRVGHYEISESELPPTYEPIQRFLGSLVSGLTNTVVGLFKRVTKSKTPEQSHGDDAPPRVSQSAESRALVDESDAGNSGASFPSSSQMAKDEGKLEWFNCVDSSDEEKPDDQDDLELLIATPVISTSSTPEPDLYEQQHAENQNHPSPNVYHSRALVSGFQAEVFVELNLSHIRGNNLWHGSQRLRSLRSLDVSHSKLKELPDLSRACNVRTLYLEGCTDLVDVSSIRNLSNLEILILRGCRSLPYLPSMIELKHLSSIDLADCSNLGGIPLSIGFLSSLVSLDLQNCKELQHLPTVVVALESLKKINISGCSKLLKLTSVTDDAENISRTLHLDASSASVQIAQVEGFHKAEVESLDQHATRDSQTESESAVELCSTPSQQHWKELQRCMAMPLEAIHEAGTFRYVEGLARTLIRQTSDLPDMSNLKDVISCLEEFKNTIPDVVMCEKAAHENRSVLQVKSTRVGLNLAEAIDEFNSLDANLAMIFEEEANLEAEFEYLMAKKMMLSEEASNLEA